VIIGGGMAVLQALILDRLPFNPYSLRQDGPITWEVDIGRGQVIRVLAVAVEAFRSRPARFLSRRQIGIFKRKTCDLLRQLGYQTLAE